MSKRLPDEMYRQSSTTLVAMETGELSLEELTELALAADPDLPFDLDAEPMAFGQADGLLPSWYMPAPARSTPWRSRTMGILILAIIGVNAMGLCVTYGFPEIGLHLP